MPDLTDKPSGGRGPFQAQADAVAVWLDGEAAAFAKRVVVPGSDRKPYEWVLVGTGARLYGADARLKLPLDFPATPAEIYVDKNLCLTLPHVEENGKVCLGMSATPADYESPAHAVVDAIRAFEEFLTKSASYAWLKKEFQDERLSYWARYCEAYKVRRRIPTPRLVQVVLPGFTGHVEGNLAGFAGGKKGEPSELWLAAADAVDANVLAHRHGWAKGTLLRGKTLFIEMPMDAAWTPSEWPDSLAELEELVAMWSRGEVSVIQWLKSKNDEKEKAQPYLIVLVQGTVAFGFCLVPPLVPVLTTVGLVPVLIERVDADWALARDHELDPLQARRDKRVLLLGCGSLGAPVAELLARAGIGHMTVVDREFFEPENTSRHILGYSSVNRSKAMELAARLRKEVPGIDVKGRHAQASSWVAYMTKQNEFDLVIDCTGESSVRCLLSTLAAKKMGAVDIAHLWMEPFCAAAHVVYLNPEDRWPSDDPADTLVNVAAWPQDGRVKLPACSAGFHLYGAADVWQVAGFSVERLLAHLDGHVERSTVWTWTRGMAFFDTLTVEAKPGTLVPKTKSSFDCVTLERPFKELLSD